jgi:hypothetical protein
MTDATRTNEPNETRPRGILIVALLMILFGLAEVVTGFTHRFFGISTTEGVASTYAGAAIGHPEHGAHDSNDGEPIGGNGEEEGE